MEPTQTHGATSPQQGLTPPAGGCLSGPRPEDLLLGGREGANPHVGRRVANEAVDCATAGTSQPPEESAISQGGHTRLHIYECFSKESKKQGKYGSPEDLTYSELVNIVMREIGQYLKPMSSIDKNRLIDKISFFLSNTMKRYRNCKSNKNLFKKRHKVYLEKSFLDDLPDDFKINVLDDRPTNANINATPISNVSEAIMIHEPSSQAGTSGSAQSKSLDTSGQELTLKRCLDESLQNDPPAQTIKEFMSEVSAASENEMTPEAMEDLETVIQSCLESPTRASKIYEQLTKDPQPYTSEEALGLMIDLKFSVETYIYLQEDAESRGYNLYPPYDQVLLARKACYPPEEITVSDVEASVTLKGLLTHTLQRIVHCSEESFVKFCEHKGTTELNCVFEGSWGFDGSAGQPFYEQSSDQSDEDPNIGNTMFATTFVPLRILADKICVIWLNPTPQSYRFCRLLHIQYKKETKDLILAEKTMVEDQIKDLPPITIKTATGLTITFICELTLSVTDGKVLKIITGTSSQLRCPFCNLTANHFNNLDLCNSKHAAKEYLKYGINPLHAWIRILEFLLLLGYKNDPAVRKWRIEQNTDESRIVEQRKSRIQAEIKRKIGLSVDLVRPNVGSTNDGYAARTALSDKYRHMFADILGLQSWLLDDLYNILVAINCELPIDSAKFGNYCRVVAEKYVTAYSWHPMTMTVHKILVHGQEVIDSNAFPVLTEQAAEFRNLFWRRDREQPYQNMNWKKTMVDIFHRALESSDPAISTLRLDSRLKRSKSVLVPLPDAVQDLLKVVDIDYYLDSDEDEHIDEEDCSEDEKYEDLIILSVEDNLIE